VDISIARLTVSLLLKDHIGQHSSENARIDPSSHFHSLDAGNVTVLIWNYPWDIRPGSVDMTVMFLDQPSRFRRFSAA